jgi:hypothetical protein
MHKLLLTTLVALCAGCSSATSTAGINSSPGMADGATAAEPRWAKRYEQQGTWGRALEDHFGSVFVSCQLPGVKHNNQLRSSVPLVLQQQFKDSMGVQVRAQNQASAGRLFAYVFASAEDAYQLRLSDEGRVLPAELFADSLEMIPFGTSRVVHLHSCQTILGAAASADAGVNVPTADLKLALQAEASGRSETRIGLVQGTNMSTLADAIERSAAPAARRLAARLYAWLWWKDHQNLVNTTQYYVQSFEGASVYMVSTTDRSASAGVNLGGGAAVPGIASIRATLHGEYARDDRTEVQRMGTIHWLTPQGQVRLTLKPLPAPTQIQDYITTNVRLAPLTPIPEVITDANTYEYITQVRGIPEPLCREDGGWSIVPDENSRLRYDTPRARLVGGACQFTISFSPIRPVAQDGVRLKYSLRTNEDINGIPLEIGGPDVRIRALGSPDLNPLAFNPDWTVSAGVLSWELAFSAEDPSNLLNWSQDVTVSSPELVCGQERIPLSPGNTARKDRPSVYVPVRRQYFPADNLAVDDHTKWRDCQYTATLQFGSRNLGVGPVTIRYPHVRPPELIPAP